VREDGRPYVAPVWFGLDGDDLVFTTWHETVKAANTRRDGGVSLCVDEEALPFAFVLVDGVAEVEDSAEGLLYWARRVASRYMGTDRAEEYGRRNSVPGELLIRVTPTKIAAKKNASDQKTSAATDLC